MKTRTGNRVLAAAGVGGVVGATLAGHTATAAALAIPRVQPLEDNGARSIETGRRAESVHSWIDYDDETGAALRGRL